MASVWREVWEVHVTVIQLTAALPTCYDTICVVHGQNNHGLLREIYTTRGIVLQSLDQSILSKDTSTIMNYSSLLLQV